MIALLRPQFLVFILGCVLVSGCTGGHVAPSPSEQETAPDPVVATVGDSTITLAEFEQAYADANHQSTPADDSLSEYQAFLEQYVNYRLKVRAAKAAGLDTVSTVQREIRSYRNEMARPRLMREQVYEPLTRTLYERRQEEVDVSHILVRVPENAAPNDTLNAYNQIHRVADSVRQGVPFGELAYRHSDDPSAQRQEERGFQGRLGYVRAGQIVDAFEDRMYTVPPDSTSEVFRSQFGYHILKVHDRRPATQPFHLSHIMIRPKEDSSTARARLDSLRTEIVRNGADFGPLAEEYSEDRRSAPNGGDLGRVESTQSLPPSFRETVPTLDSIGAVSEVVESQFGYHLIQLTDRQDPPSYEEAYDDLKNTLADRPRVDHRKDAFSRSVREAEGTSVDTARIRQAIDTTTLDTLSRPLLSVVDGTPSLNVSSSIATLGDSTYSLQQLARHVMQTDGGARLTVREVLDDFLNEKAFQYAQAQLEERDAAFAATMKEFREGLLVFQFMQDSVWNAAAKDSAGLREMYRERRDQYRFPDRIRTLTLYAPTDSLLTSYLAAYTDTTQVPSLIQKVKTDSLVTIDTTMVTDASAETYQAVRSIEDGAPVGPVEHDGESLLMIRDTLLPARRKSFEEAQSLVVRDYQDRYEDRVLSRLRRTYEVVTYPERLRDAFSDGAPDPSAPPPSPSSPAIDGG